MGKTTLLKHIAARKLAIPTHIDLLYCEQGKFSNILHFLELIKINVSTQIIRKTRKHLIFV